MIYQNAYYRNSNFFINFLIFLLLLTIPLVGSVFDIFVGISKILIYVISIFFLVVSLDKYDITKVKFGAREWLYLVLFVWLIIRSNNLFGLGLAFQTFIILMGMFFFSNFNFVKEFGKTLFLVGIAFILITFFNFYGLQFYYNTNYIGLCGLIFFICFISYGNKYAYFLAFLCLVLIILSGTRSALLAIILSFITYKILNSNKFVKLSILVLLVSLVFAFFKMGVYEYLNSDAFAELLMEKTGKRLESGRVDIWTTIFSNMNNFDYLFGMGGGVDYTSLLGEKLSPHSNYVYLFSSYGIFGLLLFIFIALISAWNLYRKEYYYSFLLFVALLLRDFFEVTLVHNSFPVAFFVWAFISNGYLDRK